jgi:hypothetical protein
MNEMTIRQIAERAYPEENLNWSVSSIIPNPKEPKQWEIYYDAWPGNYHRILFRSRPQTDPTGNALNAELRDFRRDLKKGGRL